MIFKELSKKKTFLTGNKFYYEWIKSSLELVIIKGEAKLEIWKIEFGRFIVF